MSEENTPTPLAGPELELARVRAALAAGLTYEHGVRLQGSTPEELEADAVAFAAELSAAAPVLPVIRSGGPQGPDVGNGAGAGTVGAGAAAYRAKHGLDDHGNRPERKPVPTNGRNPFTENRATWENR
jgi:hypothetical protein